MARRVRMTSIQPQQSGSLKGFGFSIHWDDEPEPQPEAPCPDLPAAEKPERRGGHG